MHRDFRDRLLEQVLTHLDSAVLVEDASRRIAHVNPQFCRMFGVDAPPEVLVGVDCARAAEASQGLFRDGDAFLSRIAWLLAEREEVRADLLELVDGRYLERDYLPLFVGSHYQGHMWVYRDVTKQERSRRQMREMAVRDDLTKLYNRRGFLEMAELQLNESRLAGQRALLLVLDMDGLKEINDSLGHAAGDAALVDFAGVITSALRHTDITARLGGDEFAALVTCAEEADVIRQRLERAIAEFNERETRAYLLAASAGFTECNEGAVLDLLAEADARMYRAKRHRKENSAVHCLSLPPTTGPERETRSLPLPDTRRIRRVSR